jgi:glycosyltransferase involved in cell wall biosynthesis
MLHLERTIDTDTKLGICIPFWGDIDYLKIAVESVRNQRDDRWTLTVINDAHPDARVDEYFASLTDARIRYVRNAQNLGITANFRRCIQFATEPLVVILGYDDLLLPTYVGSIIAAHEQYPDAAVIQPGVRVIDGEGRASEPLVDAVKQRLLRPSAHVPILLQGDVHAARLMHGNWLYWPSLAFRRDVLEKHDFRDQFAVIQDLALILDILLAGEALLVIQDVAFCYRRHDASASSTELVDGSRFAGEREFFQLASGLARAHGWRRTTVAARLHATSRLHALVLLPQALRILDRRGVAVLLRHVFGP